MSPLEGHESIPQYKGMTGRNCIEKVAFLRSVAAPKKHVLKCGDRKSRVEYSSSAILKAVMGGEGGTMTEKHVCVVGAGIGGLTSAMILAHRGFRVTVLEKEDGVGGRNRAIEFDGFSFDTGPTFLMMKFILDDMFHEVDRRPEDYMELVRLEPMYQLIFDDFAMKFTTERGEMKRQLKEHFPGSEDGLDTFLEKEGKRFGYLFPCLQRPYSSWTSLFAPIFLRALPHLSLASSVMDKVKSYFGSEELGISFSFQSKYLGMSPWTCPAAFTMLSYIEHAYGIYHIQGGLKNITASMAKVFEEEGGEIRLESPVARVLTDDERATGVELEDGEQIMADEVVLNADFGYAADELIASDHLRRWHPDKLRDKPFSCSTFMLYLGMDREYNLPHHNIIFAPDYRQNLQDIFEDKRLSDDLSYYVRNASLTDPHLAPEGKSALYVLVPVPNNKSDINWETEKPAFRDRVLDKMSELDEMGDIRDHIEAEHIITPDDWENDYNVFLGATFNLAHTVSQMMYFRPRNKFEELESCYLVGGGTHPGSGIPTILESGRISANLISEKYAVPYENPRSLEELLGESYSPEQVPELQT